MKICVYAICKNESCFAQRWYRSMAEADGIFVLDTGSEDGTAELLRELGAQVTVEEIIPWRFDVARNRSLELVPEDCDICVCTDLDEVFEPGWRTLLEQAWTAGTTQAAYRYTWNFNSDGTEGYVFWIEKAHARQGYRWIHPVHEVLQYTDSRVPARKIYVEGMQLNHHADPNKSRAQYLPLLEQAVWEDPEDDRNMHYLGREYLFRGQWDRCIRTLQYHLNMPKATWADERAASMRFIARAYIQKGDRGAARAWYWRAIAEAPHLREPYLELAKMLYEEKNWDGVLYLTGCALAIEHRPRSYICESEAWGGLLWDLRSLGLFYTGRMEEALNAVRRALEFTPKDERLKKNAELIGRAVSAD